MRRGLAGQKRGARVRGSAYIIAVAGAVGLVGVAAAQTPAPSAPQPSAPQASTSTTGTNVTGVKAPQSALSTPQNKPVVLTTAELAYLNAEAQFHAHNYAQAYLELLPIAHS